MPSRVHSRLCCSLRIMLALTPSAVLSCLFNVGSASLLTICYLLRCTHTACVCFIHKCIHLDTRLAASFTHCTFITTLQLHSHLICLRLHSHLIRLQLHSHIKLLHSLQQFTLTPGHTLPLHLHSLQQFCTWMHALQQFPLALGCTPCSSSALGCAPCSPAGCQGCSWRPET